MSCHPLLENRSTLRRQKLFANCQLFAKCKSGMAAVEFGLIAPVMLLMFIGVVELAQAITAERRMNQVMASAADLVARQKTVTDSQLAGYMNMVTPMMDPYESAPLKMTIASVYAPSSAPTTNKVCWNYQHNSGAVAIADGAPSTIAIPAGLLTGGGTGVIAVEVSYDFQPAIQFTKTFVGTSTTWRARFYLKPRLTSIVQQSGAATPCA